MTDKELLELAAKAAGLDTEWINKEDADYLAEREGLWLKGERSPDNGKYWNPLTDDGDALRLAAKLNRDYPLGLCEIFTTSEIVIADDPYAATRRAIVRAAAEIGKAREVK